MYLHARAKINLSLDVLGKREDGYHEVKMVMQMVQMFDRISMKATVGNPGIRFTANLPFLPKDDTNLVVKAAKLMMERYGITDGVEIALGKFIPVAAGLAGGSSDAAQTLVGMNRLFHLGASREDLMRIGLEIGADVPYCIMGGTALAEGIGEILTPLPAIPDCGILLCKPPVSVSTGDVYRAIDAGAVTEHPRIDRQIEALRRGDLAGVAHPSAMSNVLENVTGGNYPVIAEIEKVMKQNGALHAVMSGSGPTVFGIFDDKNAAESCRDLLRGRYPAARTFLTGPAR